MKSTILVIDVQNGLFGSSPEPFEAKEIVQRINQITRRARRRNIPIIFIQAEHPDFLEYGTEEWQIHAALTVEGSDYKLRKTKANSFLETNLQEVLEELEADNLIVCGYSTEFCVDSTVRYASSLGYNVELVADCHTTQDKSHLSAKQIREHHNITLSKSPTISVVLSKDLILES